MVRRYVKGRATPQESDFLDAWDHYLDTHHDAFARLPQQERDAIQDTILDELKSVIHTSKPRQTTIYRWAPYAAAMLIAVTAATWIFFGDAIVHYKATIVNAEDIVPGTNRATLTLADGRTIDLSETQTGIIIDEGITYADGTDLTSGDGKSAEIAKLSAEIVNELVLTTPKGGTYQVTLPDGSRVWLNASSALKYPSRFSGKERVVFLEGEAYFDIKSMPLPAGLPAPIGREGIGRLPFKVITNNQTIEVLGTEFNISAYAEDADTKTTLVEGSVQLSPLGGGRVVTLSPGQQAITRGSAIETKRVDTEPYTAWKDGFFYFDRLPTQAAIAQLARWYDLDVIYEGKLADVNMFAYIERNKPLSAVLKALEKSGLKFRVSQSGKRNQLIVLGEQ
ncbi:FecR family protein [Parapedobacter koreensis]|uniref:FecR family protein n=2 Tax=Parapedobacter koreensis TaxID=332977 RepID=A0A1H7MQZ3_9SPHI|nr:FecR family protein [Parapedobacter koreensis]